MMKTFLMASCLLLASCSTVDNLFGDDNDSKTLQGDRLSLFEFEKSLQRDTDTQFGIDGSSENQNVIALSRTLIDGVDSTMALDAPWDNQFWPQVGGYPNHAMKHLSFNEGAPKKAWSTSVGRGGSKRMPLISPPIMADGKVFAMNNKAEIVAVNHDNGKTIWETDILKDGEDEIVIGGGMAFSGGRLFATNGFNELIALNPDNGNVLWRTETKTPIRAAPSAIPDRVFVVTMDNQTLAFNASNGEAVWSHRGLDSGAGVLGAATPAISREAVITAYGSGEIYALHIDTGLELWSENLSPLARVAGRTSMSDIRALPVINDNIVYAASYTNRMSAIDARTGKALWNVPLGTGSTPWVSGNRVFIAESQGALISLDRLSGESVWQTALPRYEDPDDRDDIIHWTGPVLAGNRLIVFGSNGRAQSYNPVDGTLIREWKLGDAVYVMPAIAKGTLTILDNDGDLTQWR